MFSYGMQVPSALGQAAGIGAGAFAGAKLGGAFGPIGMAAGAIGGGLLAGRTGIAETIGDFAQLPFRPMAETRQMGMAAQRMSQDWVVSGPQLHATGRGLIQQAGIGLAGGMRELASDSGFKEQTGGMFNRQDLMRMTQMSGQAGLMDMAQSVPAIQQQLRQVAVTVKKFMELTNDPDITNVIREMGQMRSFGMNMGQINQAAENMKMFSRAAGTSIRGMREAGGMPGAAVYQGMGLTAGQGFDYGNYSLAMARQTVAGGAVDPRQLAILGGVQGMAQRNMQAQASFLSTPMFAAANASYGAGGWGAGENPASMDGGRGAFGMVTGAVQNMNAAVRRGGIGALASFGMQQQEIADEAASKMTPMEQTAQRFRMARETGQRFRGMNAMDQFNFGAQLMYGPEVANQMSVQARNPDMWASQQRMYQQRADQLASEGRQRTIDAAPGFFGHLAEKTGIPKALGSAGAQIKEGVSAPFRDLGSWAGDKMDRIGDYFGTPEGVSRFRGHRGTSMTSAQASSIRGEKGLGRSIAASQQPSFMGEWNRMAEYSRALANSGATGVATGNWIAGGLSNLTSIGPVGLTENATLALGGVMNQGLYSMDEQDKLIRSMHSDEERAFSIVERGKKKTGDIKDITAGSDALTKAVGVDGYEVINRASTLLARKAKDYTFSPNEMTSKDHDNAMIDAIVEVSASKGQKISRSEAAARYAKMPSSGKETALSQASSMAAQGDPTVKKVLEVSSSGEQRKRYFDRVDKATENLQDKQMESREGLEMKLFQAGRGALGTEQDPSSGWSAEGYMGSSEGFVKAKEFAKGSSSNVTALVAAASASIAGGDLKAMQRGKEFFLKGGGKEKDWIQTWENAKKLSNSLKDAQGRMAVFGAGGDLSKVADWSKSLKDEGIVKGLRSQKFAGQFEEFGGNKFRAAMTEDKGQITNIDEMLEAVGDEGISEMRKKGNKTQKALGALAAKARKGGPGGEKARARLMEYAARQSEDVEDRQTVTPEGDAAKSAEASADAAGEMTLVAQQFGPAVTDFAKAAKMLLDTAVIQRANSSQGRNE
jgi:hypothetical protein